MAFRLRPLHEDTLQFAGLSNTQILILALEASQKLEWNIEELTLEGVRFDVPMSIKSHGEEITVSIQEGSDGEISVRSQSIAMQLVDYGKNRKNIQSLQKAMEEIKSTLSPEELEQKAKKLEDDFNRPLTEEEEAYLKEIEKKSSFISFFIPRKGFIATPILMDLNLLIFILMVAFGVGILEPSTLALLKWGADFGPLTLTGDWWRAITCNFIHRRFPLADEYVCFHVYRTLVGGPDRNAAYVHLLSAHRGLFGSLQSLYARRNNQCRSFRSDLRTLRHLSGFPPFSPHPESTTESIIN